MAAEPTNPPAAVTWPELMAATSLAADTGMALPLETGLATCLVAVALGRSLGLDEKVLEPSPFLRALAEVAISGDTLEGIAL